MTPSLSQVFLSSTIYDLKDLRNAVQTALENEGYTVLASEAGTIPTDSTKHSYDTSKGELFKAMEAIDGKKKFHREKEAHDFNP